tara:strand:- start:15887 stop:16495 length:609 start_codon:yes stop_codon:yes gene_type:complete
MSRSIHSNIVSALANPEIEPFYAVKLSFSTGTLYLWTGYGNKTINSETYLGSGNLLSIDGLEEASDLSATGTDIVLNGIDSTILTYALTEEYQGREVNIYWGVSDVSEVVEVFSGYMDQMTIVDKGDTSTIKLSVESKLIILERPNIRRYTEGSHAAVIATENTRDNTTYTESNDSFFRWVAKLQDVQVPWGRQTETGDETS